MQWVGYTHDEVTWKIYSLGQDWRDFPAKEKQLASLLKFHCLQPDGGVSASAVGQ